MTKILIVTVFVMWTLSACRTESMKDKADNLQTPLHYDTTTTAVISWDKDFYNLFDSLNHQSATLTKKDIEQVDKALDEIIEENNSLRSAGGDDYKIDVNAKDYRKQLIVVTNSKGEKEVWVNCYCYNWDKSWRTRLIAIGYDRYCFFNFKLNLTLDIVYDFRVNMDLYK